MSFHLILLMLQLLFNDESWHFIQLYTLPSVQIRFTG